jgi:hypothetical protein
MGRWICQTIEGRAVLEFVSDTELVFNGEPSYYTHVQGAIRVMEEWGPVDYGYTVNGDRLRVTNPDGSITNCERQTQPRRGEGGGLERLLQGERCAYSSSPDGGFSTTRRVFFDGNGRFVYAELGEFDVPEAIGYGQGEGMPGTYRVLGTSRGDEVHLTFDNGGETILYVHREDGGTIRELWHRSNMVYSPDLCPGGTP